MSAGDDAKKRAEEEARTKAEAEQREAWLNQRLSEAYRPLPGDK